ncbi:hypothetical protein B7P43_G06466, partial [Cryptotermes secundus]
GWEVLYHPPYSPDLSPCDFNLIPKMKEPLRAIRFRTVPDILQAVDRSIRTINTTGAAKGILRLSADDDVQELAVVHSHKAHPVLLLDAMRTSRGHVMEFEYLEQ